MKMGLSKGQNRIELGIPHNMIGLVIGKGGETVKSINAKTGVLFTPPPQPLPSPTPSLPSIYIIN